MHVQFCLYKPRSHVFKQCFLQIEWGLHRFENFGFKSLLEPSNM